MWFLLALAHAACPPDLSADLDRLAAAPSIARANVDNWLACHPADLDPTEAARVHQLYARVAEAEADLPRAARHLYAAWETQPFALAAPSPSVARALQTLQEGPAPAKVAVPAPHTAVDGRPSPWMRASQPALLQHSGAAPVLYEAAGTSRSVDPSKPARKSPAILVGGIVSTALGGLMYGGAWASRANYDELLLTPGNDAAREQAHARTNGLAVGATVGLAAGAGLIGVHLIR